MNSRTASSVYTDRLVNLQSVWWKKLFDVQAPYRWNIKRLNLGKCLDVGCGIGRNLINLSPESIGVDHNEHSVQKVRELGLKAYTTAEFFTSKDALPQSFDSLLVAHVLEHMNFEDGSTVLNTYLPFLKKGGKVVLITPQLAGYESDSTHVEYMPFSRLEDHVQALGLFVEKEYSFPFPQIAGSFFKYNEFVVVAKGK